MHEVDAWVSGVGEVSDILQSAPAFRGCSPRMLIMMSYLIGQSSREALLAQRVRLAQRYLAMSCSQPSQQPIAAQQSTFSGGVAPL